MGRNSVRLYVQIYTFTAMHPKIFFRKYHLLQLVLIENLPVPVPVPCRNDNCKGERVSGCEKEVWFFVLKVSSNFISFLRKNIEIGFWRLDIVTPCNNGSPRNNGSGISLIFRMCNSELREMKNSSFCYVHFLMWHLFMMRSFCNDSADPLHYKEFRIFDPSFGFHSHTTFFKSRDHLQML